MNDQYEVEIKSLLGAKEHADKLRNALQNIDPAMKLVGKGSQLNHYFLPPPDAEYNRWVQHRNRVVYFNRSLGSR
jgi:hypothetical protein